MPHRKTKKKRQQHPAPWHILLQPLEFELPVLLDDTLTFTNVFEDCSAFGLTPSFDKLLANADAARSALLLFLVQQGESHHGGTPLHHHINLKRRTAALYAAIGKEFSSLIDRYLAPLNKLCALVESRIIVETGNVVFGWSDAAPGLNNRVEMFDRFHKLVLPKYLSWSEQDDLYIMRHRSVHFERSNVLFLRGILYYVQAAKHMHTLKDTNSAKLLAETWHSLQQASGVFQCLRQINHSKSEILSTAVRSVAVNAPTMRVLANFVAMQQHYVALAVETSKHISHGRLALCCTEFFSASQSVIEMAMSIDIHASPQSKPLIEATKFMHSFLRGLYFKHVATQQAAGKKYNEAEVAMDLSYRSFLPKLKVKLDLFEGGADPLSQGIREEVDDSYSTTTRFREMGEDSGLVERTGLQIIRQKMVQDLAGHTTSVAAMANLLSKKMGQELSFERYDNVMGTIDSYTVRKMGTKSGGRSRSDSRRDDSRSIDEAPSLGSSSVPSSSSSSSSFTAVNPTSAAITHNQRRVSSIEGQSIQELLDPTPQETNFFEKGQALPNMFADADAQKNGNATTTNYHHPLRTFYGHGSEAARTKRKTGITWSGTTIGQQRVFFERIMTNHELAIRGEFLQRKSVRPTSADLSTPSKDDIGGTLFVPPARDQTCAMCEGMYSVLPGTVTLNSILTFRGEHSTRPASYKYQAVQVCVFCLQFHYQTGGASATAQKIATAAAQGGGNLLSKSASLPSGLHTATTKAASLMRGAGSPSLHGHSGSHLALPGLHLEGGKQAVKEGENNDDHMKMKHNLEHQTHVGLELLAAAHTQKKYRRGRRKSSLINNHEVADESLDHLLKDGETCQVPFGFTGELARIDAERVLNLTRVPKQALFTRGEQSSAGKVNELFYNMASQYQNDDAYDDWASDIEEYFEINGELDSIRLFFTRVSTKPQNQLNASNMTMEGVVSLCYVLDLLLEGSLGDWRVQNILRTSQHVNHMLKSGIGASIRMNDAPNVGDITFHQFLAIVQSANDPINRDYGLIGGSMSSVLSQEYSLNSVGQWALPGADQSMHLADEEDYQRKLDIRSFSEGVPGGSNHLRHVMHADQQYYRVRDLIRSMNVMMPGESQRMRVSRHNKGKMESHVAKIHKGVQDREDEKKKLEELRKLQRKAHEIGNLNLSSAERAKLAAEGGGVINIHKRKCGLCTRLFSKPNLPTKATRGAIEDLREAIAEKAEKRILVAKYSGKRVEIPLSAKKKAMNPGNMKNMAKRVKRSMNGMKKLMKSIKTKNGTNDGSGRNMIHTEFVLVGTFDAGQEAFQVTHNDGSNSMQTWTKARHWKLFNRAKEPKQIITDPTVLAQMKAEKEAKEKKQAERLKTIQTKEKTSRWGKMKGATNVFGGGVALKKKKEKQEKETFFIQKKLEKEEEENKSLQKLAALKSGGKVRRIANRTKAKTMRKYDGVKLCVFCTQFYEHAVFVESKKFIRPRAPQPKVPTFQSMQALLAQEQEQQRKRLEEEERARREAAKGDPITIEHQQSVRRNMHRSIDRLPDLIDDNLLITLPLVKNENSSAECEGTRTRMMEEGEEEGGVERERGEEGGEGEEQGEPEEVNQTDEERWAKEAAKEEEEENIVNDLMTVLGLNLAKIGDIAFKRMQNAKLTNRLRYLAAVRAQSSARSFLVRLHWIKMYAKETNALKAGISEFTEQIAELKAKKKELLRAKRKKTREQKERIEKEKEKQRAAAIKLKEQGNTRK